MNLVIRVSSGHELPRFYGVAWHDYCRRQAVCMPLPLNVVARVARDVWWWLRLSPTFFDAKVSEAASEAWKDGWERGVASGAAALREHDVL